jgi:hypothetical protein
MRTFKLPTAYIKGINMTELELYKFINDNNCEFHWESREDDLDVILFVNSIWIEDFNKLFDYNFFDDGGYECIMMNDYFCFWMQSICDYYGIDIKNIFKE